MPNVSFSRTEVQFVFLQDLRNASHDEAVDVIRQSGSSVLFVVQSLLGVATAGTETGTSATPTVTGDEEEEEEEESSTQVKEQFRF